MALTPEQIQAARTKFGIPQPPDPIITNRTSALDTAWGAPKQPNIIEKAVGGAAHALEDTGRSIADSLHKNDPNNLGSQIATGADIAGKTTSAPFNAAFGAVGAVTPDAIKEPLKKAVGTAVQGVKDTVDAIPAAKKSIETVQKLAQEHPNVAKLLEGLGMTAINVGTVGAGGAGAKVAGKVATEAADITGSKVVSTVEKAFTPSEQSVDKFVTDTFERAVKPTIVGRKTVGAAGEYKNKVVNAVNSIVQNKNNLKFTNEFGEVTEGALPKSLSQFGHSIEQTKKGIFDQYDALATQASEKGATIDLTDTAKALDEVINNKAINLSHPEAVDYAKKLKDRLLSEGTLDTKTAQDLVQNYNGALEAFYRNPSYETASRAAIDAGIVNSMRKSLDNVIESATGKEYQALKNQYGALKTIEKDVVKRANVDARKNAQGLLDYTDIFSGGDMVHGILTLNPALFAKGAAQKSIKEYLKFLNDPNRAIEKLFKKAEVRPGGAAPTPPAAAAAMDTKLAPVQLSSPVGIAEEHITSAKQILDNLPEEELTKLGGMPALLERTKINIVDGLKAEGLTKEAGLLNGLDSSHFKTLEEFDKAMRKGLDIFTPVPVEMPPAEIISPVITPPSP